MTDEKRDLDIDIARQETSKREAGETHHEQPEYSQGESNPDYNQTESENEPHYAGFWLRVLATLLDGLVLFCFYFLLEWVLGVDQNGMSVPPAISFLENVVSVLYFVLLTTFLGQTLGKMAVGIEVVMQDGRSNHFGWILLRETIGKFVSIIILGIGFIMVAFDAKKRGLHDHIGKTYVVKRK